MEDFLVLLVQAGAGLAVSVLLFCFFLARPDWTNENGPREAPEPPGKWPVIGHLHHLRDTVSIAETLGAMADKHGPAITVRLGIRPTLVVSSSELARECFSVNDRAFATRPSTAAGKYMGFDYAMFGFAPYGSYWREIRKLATLHVNARLDSLRAVRVAEVNAQVKKLYRAAGDVQRPAKIDVLEWCADVTHNVMLQMVVGKRFDDDDDDGGEGRRFKKAIRRFFSLLISSMALDAIPLLGWVNWGGTKREMKKTAAEMDSILSRRLEEHKTKKGDPGAGDEEVKDEDFMDVMLSTVKDLKIEGYDDDTVVKATCLALILGGTDTTSVSLAWALCFTVSHPGVLKRAQEELATHVGNRRNVDESDVPNLLYLQSIVKETLRFTPAVPLIINHEAMEDCVVGGFRVPAGTQLIVNLRKMLQDPAVWPEPSEFRPERFMTSHAGVDVRGQHFELIPFGSGRRVCPGVSFALRVIHLVLARLIHGFEMEMESSEEDWQKGLRMGDSKASGLKILLTPRLPFELYE